MFHEGSPQNAKNLLNKLEVKPWQMLLQVWYTYPTVTDRWKNRMVKLHNSNIYLVQQCYISPSTRTPARTHWGKTIVSGHEIAVKIACKSNFLVESEKKNVSKLSPTKCHSLSQSGWHTLEHLHLQGVFPGT